MRVFTKLVSSSANGSNVFEVLFSRLMAVHHAVWTTRKMYSIVYYIVGARLSVAPLLLETDICYNYLKQLKEPSAIVNTAEHLRKLICFRPSVERLCPMKLLRRRPTVF
jgi:hypothetical protein